MPLTPQGVPTSPGLTYVNIARSLPFQYTFRGDDFMEFNPATRDLFENRDRELELSLININGAIPIGGVTMFGGLVAAIPFNYLPCDGRTLDTTEFADLFNVIGYRYGGSGANFILPDLYNYSAVKTVSSDGTATAGLIGMNGFASTGHTHTLTSPQSSGHTHNFNQTGNTSSSGHTHTLGASTGNGGVDHYHGATTGGASLNTHAHSYTKPNAGSTQTTGTGNHGHTHDLATGFSTSYVHAHNAAANVNATNADTAHVHNASTILSSTADTAHTHTANATNTDSLHGHTIPAIGFYFIIRYQ